MLCRLDALISHFLGFFKLDVCKDDASGTGFGERERGFFSDARCSLQLVVSRDEPGQIKKEELGFSCPRTPVTRAMPPSRSSLEAIAYRGGREIKRRYQLPTEIENIAGGNISNC